MAKRKAKTETGMGPMYIFKCSGRYFTKLREVAGTRARQAKDFKVDIKIPAGDIDIFIEKHRNVGKQIDDPKNHLKIVNEVKEVVFRNYGGVLRKKLVPLKLAAIAEAKGGYEDFSRIRNMRVDEVIGINGAKVSDLDLPLNMLSMPQIFDFCSKNGILSDVIDVHSYLDIDDLRSDLYEYMDDPEVFRRKVDEGKTKGGRGSKHRSIFLEERERERRFREINDIEDGSVVSGKRGVVRTIIPEEEPKDNISELF
jgi:hypothetical protein